MDLFEEGIYRPIRALFDSHNYSHIFLTCWNYPSYKFHVAIVAELLRIQKENRLASEVTPEDMARHVYEMSKRSQRMKLLDILLQFSHDDEDRDLLSMAREVNDSMRMSDITLEAQWLLNAPERMPPNFRKANIVKKAKAIWEELTERQQTPCSERLQQPRDVVLDVVPKVLQVLWVPKRQLLLTMPSLKLDRMAVGVTKAVEDEVLAALGSTTHESIMSSSARDEMIASIVETIVEAYPEDIWGKMLQSFSPRLLHHITEVTAKQIAALFQPQGNQEEAIYEEVRQSPAPSPPIHSDEDAAADLEDDKTVPQSACIVHRESTLSESPPSQKKKKKSWKKFTRWMQERLFN